MLLRFVPTAALAAVLTFAVCGPAAAALMPLDASAFTGPAQVTFTGVADFTEGNEYSEDGLTFIYGPIPDGLDGQLFVTSLALPTSTLVDPVLGTFVPPTEMLTVNFATPVIAFGFDFAFNAFVEDATALSISVFSGTDLLGSLAFGSLFNPLPGGFAGLRSDVAFDRAVITFAQEGQQAVALDNFRTIVRTIPEPSSLALLGIAALAVLRRRSMR